MKFLDHYLSVLNKYYMWGWSQTSLDSWLLHREWDHQLELTSSRSRRPIPLWWFPLLPSDGHQRTADLMTVDLSLFAYSPEERPISYLKNQPRCFLNDRHRLTVNRHVKSATSICAWNRHKNNLDWLPKVLLHPAIVTSFINKNLQLSFLSLVKVNFSTRRSCTASPTIPRRGSIAHILSLSPAHRGWNTVATDVISQVIHPLIHLSIYPNIHLINSLFDHLP